MTIHERVGAPRCGDGGSPSTEPVADTRADDDYYRQRRGGLSPVFLTLATTFEVLLI